MPVPVAVRRRHPPRLESLKAKAPAPSQQTTPRDSPAPQVSKAPGACCESPEYDPYADNPNQCLHCGVSRHEESSLQAELEWGETGSGAAMVVGGLIAEDQRHANTMGGTMRGLGGLESREKTLYKGKDEIAKLAAALRLRGIVIEQAISLYKIALNHSFVQGRRIRNVAACCIYLADRRQPESTLFLMDLAEKIRVNVWTLGDTYKQFLQITYNEDPGASAAANKLPELEPLVLKFCRKLEFGSDSHRVAEDACKLIKRMKRDWMVDGRQPAGIIGAAIILAARMNNFRRTVREVVYCVKVADSTIHHRLHEFKRTKAAELSVKQMREVGLLLKDDVLPPAIYKRQEKEERKRKRLARAMAEAEAEADATPDADVVETTTTKTGRPAKKRKTTKAAGQPTTSEEHGDEVDLPGADPQSERHLDAVAAGLAAELGEELGEGITEEVATLPKKRGRPRKKREPLVIAQEDLDIEADIEDEVQEQLRDWASIFKEFNTKDGQPEHPVYYEAKKVGDALAEKHERNRGRYDEMHPPEVEEEEFLDDEDVMNCLNTPEEVAIKEKVWITENEDWLRDQQAKLLAKELEDASGKPKKPKRQRKRAMMGDGSVLEGEAARSAADATQKMLDRRAKFSSHINYEVLQGLLDPVEDDDESAEVSREGSVHPQPAPASNNVNEAEVVEEYYDEEEDEEPQEVYDDEDLELNYRSESDVGFEEDHDDFYQKKRRCE